MKFQKREERPTMPSWLFLAVARRNARELALHTDFWNHDEERGTAFIPDRLQEISPCWSCFTLYRFNQYQNPSGVDWKGLDSEEGFVSGSCAKALAHVRLKRRLLELEDRCE